MCLKIKPSCNVPASKQSTVAGLATLDRMPSIQLPYSIVSHPDTMKTHAAAARGGSQLSASGAALCKKIMATLKRRLVTLIKDTGPFASIEYGNTSSLCTGVEWSYPFSRRRVMNCHGHAETCFSTFSLSLSPFTALRYQQAVHSRCFLGSGR